MKTKWNPIDTAPKDGAEILIFVRFSDGNAAIKGAWDSYYQCWWDVEQRCGIDEGLTTDWLPYPEEPESRITSLEQQLADSETRVGLLESSLKAIVMQLNNSLHFAERLAGIRRIIEGIPNLILKEPLVLQDDSIESWLNKLPAGYRELALANYRAGSTTRKRADSVTSALWCAFIWQDTPEGYDFWLRVATRFGLADHSLPALPEIQQP